ncbi:xylan 1,4-beta-xylosidase [Nonomuraea sp. NPDC050556]|uniref:xylan 1,4-beta-xylosidase n=1 Tax=Nonomuraea sp. NPDC050556 TaxID=3364369 RepID=UPI0037879B95
MGALAVAVLIYNARSGASPAAGKVTSTTAPGKIGKPPPVDAAWPRYGLTHTQLSANNGKEQLQDVVAGPLSKTPMLQNQHIMGFGVDNPEESPGRFDFEDLDDRMRLMDQSGGVPVLTLCCAPDWMKGGPAGQTSWEKEHLEAAPEPKHFDDFARLAAEVAKRYDHVKYFMVWNELKGFWPDHKQPPDIQGYTQLYNKVYAAVKAVRPDALIGGPYLGMNSNEGDNSELKGAWGSVDQLVLDAFDYWWKNKKGADFVVVDGASPTDDHQLLPDAFGATGKFSAVTSWLRKRTGDMPIWWSEYYFEPEDGSANWTPQMRLAVQAAALMEFARSGASTALYWNPETKSGDCAGCMWNQGTGAWLPTGELLSNFTKWFPAGAKLESVKSSSPGIRVLAQPGQLVMVNTTDAPISATVDGKQVTLQPYEVKWAGR